MSLKEKIFEYLQGRQPERNPRFPHFNKPLTVLVIYESDPIERNDALKTIHQDLRRKGMDVSLWGFVAKKSKEITSPVLPQSRIIGLDEYNLFGKPREEVLEALQARKYDLMIDLTTHNCLQLRYLAMYAQADCKVGLNLGEGIHDMLIAPPDLDAEKARPEVTWLYNLIVQYLSMIKSND
jgi:hypothetical protein